MKSLVIYATRSGNTRRVAESIAATLGEFGEVSLLDVEKAPAEPPEADLIVIGGPTEGHGVSPPLTAYLTRLDHNVVAGRSAAAFDTRLTWPRLLSGSAADGIAKWLTGAGAQLVVRPESFMVNTKPALLAGELERAPVWARAVAERVAATAPVVA